MGIHSCFCNGQESDLTATLPDAEMIDQVSERSVIYVTGVDFIISQYELTEAVFNMSV